MQFPEANPGLVQDQGSTEGKQNQYWLHFLLTAGAYWAAGRLALLLAIPPGYATAVWPAAGLGLACLLLFGNRMWPAILAGSFFINIGTSFDTSKAGSLIAPLAAPLCIGGGAALQAALGASLIRRFAGFPTPLLKNQDVIRFLLLGGPTSCMVSPTVGVSALWLVETVPSSQVLFNWWTWWVGDTIGAVLFAPLVVVLAPSSRNSRRRKLSLAVPLGLAFALVVAVFLNASGREQDRIRRQFQAHTDVVSQSLRRELDGALKLLHSVRGLWDSLPSVSHDTFGKFVKRLFPRQAGLQAVEWVPRVRHAERVQHEDGARQEGWAQFQILEEDAAGQMVPAAPRPEYFPIRFIEPKETNARVLGFDTSSDPVRMQALRRAASRGTVVVTSPLRLPQFIDRNLGLLLILPVYAEGQVPDSEPLRQDKVAGYVQCVFRLADVIGPILREFGHDDVVLRILDRDEAGGLVSLYEPLASATASSGAAPFRRTVPFPFADRDWELEFTATAGYMTAQRSLQAWSILAGGLMFAGVLGAFLLSVTGRTVEVEALVRERTDQLWNANQNLQQQVAERERVKNEVRQLNEQLEAKVLERTEQLQKSNRSLQEEIACHERTETVLRRTEERTRMIITSSLDGVVTIDASGVVMEWNPQAEKIFGWTEREILGKSLSSTIVPVRYRAAHEAGIKRFLETGQGKIVSQRIEFAALHRSGHEFPIELSIVPITLGNRITFSAFIRDISARKRIEHELRDSRERYELALRGTNDGVWDWNIITDEDHFSARFCELIGYAPNELSQTFNTWRSHLHPEERDSVLAAVRRHLEERIPYDVEHRLRTKQGTYRWFRARGQAIWDETGRPVRMAGSISDVTERRQTELRQAAQYEITRLLGDADEFDEVLATRLLQVMAESLNWDLAELWTVDPEVSVLRCAALWHRSKLNAMAFSSAARALALKPGDGLPGQIWSSLKHSRIRNITTEPGFLRTQEAARAGLREGFGFPLRGGPEAVGVLVLFSCRARTPDDPTPQMAPALGSQIGQFVIRKRAEAEIRKLNIQLEARVRERTAQLESVNRQLESDIAERRRVEEGLRQSEERFATVFHASPVAVSITTLEQGRFVDVNDAFLSLFGYERSEVIGRTSLELGMWPDPKDRAKILQQLQAGEALHEVESSFRTKSGEIRQSLSSAQQITLQESPCVITILQDVTERARQREELRRAKEDAEAAARAKSEFLASMSHEIRTPMNGVLGMLELLQDSALNASQREHLQLARSSAEALLTIIDDILDISKLEAGKVTIESIPFDYRLALEEVVRLFAAKAQEKKLKFLLRYPASVPNWVLGDPARLRQVVINLVGNAIKFTPAGYVLVSVRMLEISEDEAVLQTCITDTGIGIPEAQRSRIFERFTQADSSTTRRYGGTGLGLSICRRLLELMGGEISVESQEGQGSVFSFSCRFRNAAAQAPKPPPRDELKGVRLLAVVPHELSRQILIEQASQWGMEVSAFAGTADATREVQHPNLAAVPFDVAVIDEEVPQSALASLAVHLNDDHLEHGPAWVLLSSQNHGRAALGTRPPGFDAYLAKPYRESELYQTLVSARAPSPRTPEAPRAASAEPAVRLSEKEPAPDPAALIRARVLVVDDNATNQKVATLLLQRLNCRTEVASNGREAVAKAAQGVFNLIFMDCEMPEMDGFEATAQIRALSSASRHVPIVAMTAKVMPGDRERCMASGMNDYLAKPINKEKVHAMLSRWVSQSSVTEASANTEGMHLPGVEPAVAGPETALEKERIDELMTMAGGRASKDFREILEVFLSETPKRLSLMRAALAKPDWPSLRSGAHTLKGSSSLLGAKTMAQQCHELEQMAEASGLHEAGLLLGRLDTEFLRVRQELDGYLNESIK